VAFFIDDRIVSVVRQSPAYPMQFLPSIYEFAEGPEPASPADQYPKEFVVEQFRGSRPITGAATRARAFPTRTAPASRRG
jgi:hypothetical protein